MPRHDPADLARRRLFAPDAPVPAVRQRAAVQALVGERDERSTAGTRASHPGSNGVGLQAEVILVPEDGTTYVLRRPATGRRSRPATLLSAREAATPYQAARNTRRVSARQNTGRGSHYRMWL